ARHQHVDALGRADPDRVTDAREELELARPDAGGEHGRARPHLKLLAALLVTQPGALDARSADEAGDGHARHGNRAVGERGAEERQRKPRIVRLRIEVANRADQRVVTQRRRRGERCAAAEVPVTRYLGMPAAEAVVEGDTGAEVAALPPLPDREQK